MLLFAAIVVLDNAEIEKIFPSSNARTLLLMFGYIVAIMSFNYVMGLRGRNFMGWKVELALVSLFVFLFLAVFLPFGFPQLTENRDGGFAGFFETTSVDIAPEWAWSWIGVSALPLAVYIIWKLRRLKLWERSL